jgi:hypothetical protein
VSLGDTGNPAALLKFRPGAGRPRDFDGNVQAIASAAHARGVILTRAGEVVGSIEAAELCRILRAAHETTRGRAHNHDHVVRLANGIAIGIGARGPVEVSRQALNLLSGYARPKARVADGGVERCSEAKRGPARCRKDIGTDARAKKNGQG